MKSEAEKYQRLVNRFIALANNMKDEGMDPKMVSDALMFASGTYATFVITGNNGGLTESGAAKVAALYQERLLQVQSAKRHGLIGDDDKKGSKK